MPKHDIKGALPKDAVPIGGPAFTDRQAAEYIGVSVRHIHVLQEQNLLPFFNIGPKLRRTTKPLCDALLQKCLSAALHEMEGDAK